MVLMIIIILIDENNNENNVDFVLKSCKAQVFVAVNGLLWLFVKLSYSEILIKRNNMI